MSLIDKVDINVDTSLPYFEMFDLKPFPLSKNLHVTNCENFLDIIANNRMPQFWFTRKYHPNPPGNLKGAGT